MRSSSGTTVVNLKEYNTVLFICLILEKRAIPFWLKCPLNTKRLVKKNICSMIKD